MPEIETVTQSVEAIERFVALGLPAFFVLFSILLYVIIRQFGGDSQRSDGNMTKIIDLMGQSQENSKAMTKALENNTEVVRGINDIPRQLQEQQKIMVTTIVETVQKEQGNVLEWTKTLQATISLFNDKFNDTINATKDNRELSRAANVAIVQELENLKQAIEKLLVVAEQLTAGEIDQDAARGELTQVIKDLSVSEPAKEDKTDE